MKILKLFILLFILNTIAYSSNVKPLGFTMGNGFSPMRDSLCALTSIETLRILNMKKFRNKEVFVKIDKESFCSDKSKAEKFFENAALNNSPKHVRRKEFENIIYVDMGFTLFADSINIKGIDFELQVFLSPNHSQAETIGAYLSAKNDTVTVNDLKAVIEYKKPQKYLLPFSVTGIKLVAKDKDLFRENSKIFTDMLGKKYNIKPHYRDTFICDEDTEVAVHYNGSIEYKNINLRDKNKKAYSTYLKNKLKNSKNDLSGSL